MKTYNLAFLVKVSLEDKRFYMTCKNQKEQDGCISENRIVIGNQAYYKPVVQLFFSGDVTATRYFNNFEDATKWADDMSGHIKETDKLVIED